METLIVGERGQITIPKEMRRQLGIEPKQPVQVEVRDNMLCIRPVLTVPLRVFDDARIAEMVREDTLEYGELERILDNLRFDESLYTRAKEAAATHKTSFTAFVQGALSEALRREEQKTLFDAFSLVGQDHEEADVEFALSAQREVLDSHE